MANNYLRFSEVIRNLTSEEESWFKKQLEYVYVFGDKVYGEGAVPLELGNTAPDRVCYRFISEESAAVCDSICEFDYRFWRNVADSRYGDCYLHLFSDSFVEPMPIACLVQQFLKKFRPGTGWCLRFAAYCDKALVGEFGGGIIFVTADDVELITSDNLAGHWSTRLGLKNISTNYP